jgi:hypothetical protein
MVGEGKPEHPLPHRRPPFNRRQLLMQVAVAVVILASGIGIGGGGTILALQDRIVWKIPSPPPEQGRPPRPDVLEMLRTKYDLSDGQVEKVKTLFAQRLEAARERRRQVDAIEQAEREKLVEDMRPILTSEQFERWHADYVNMITEMRNRPFWGPRGGGERRGPPHGDRGPGRPMGPEGGRRGNWPPRPPGGPDSIHKGDHPAEPPAEVKSRPADVNAPK